MMYMATGSVCRFAVCLRVDNAQSMYLHVVTRVLLIPDQPRHLKHVSTTVMTRDNEGSTTGTRRTKWTECVWGENCGRTSWRDQKKEARGKHIWREDCGETRGGD